jgi:hypothetical protein
MLLAMATGTGKTKTCIALIYRLLKAKRVRRVLFLVDRSALGDQAEATSGARTPWRLWHVVWVAHRSREGETHSALASHDRKGPTLVHQN